MTNVNHVAIGVAALTAFVVSMGYYMIFGNQLAAARARRLPGRTGPEPAARPPAWKLLAELLRNLILASVLAGLAAAMEITDWSGGLRLGLVVWVGFPVVLWTGAMIWENEPWRFAAIHAGDWLLKLLAIALIVGAWQ